MKDINEFAVKMFKNCEFKELIDLGFDISIQTKYCPLRENIILYDENNEVLAHMVIKYEVSQAK